MATRTVVVSENNIDVVEVATLIEFGAADITYPAKRLSYTDGDISEIRLYSDPAATQLAERRTITRTGGQVTSIGYFDGAGTLLHTRTFSYSPDGSLSGLSDAAP